ncbi:O-antigen ligase family protein [uncultured Chitinophaga sp.]|jgi:Predicted membrane-associated, metal-dependent hydrolase|uniref:O-antigen ligase family protein n=1 Tax=uncultured Chitinophaga sp. TaxID=339340 RepID=UPI0026106098|nr:O-antigen ligase family protein [uncultured Chitinophaga sp.]
MLVTRARIQSSLLFVSHFFNFAGYYFFLVILSNLGLIALSRSMTIPIRMLILGCFCFILVMRRKVYLRPPIRWFLLFAAIYIGRIIIDMMMMKVYHIDISEFLLYFLAFGAIPLLAISGMKLREYDLDAIKWSMLISGLLLSVMTLLFYRNLIGSVGRISQAISREDNYISPLALSYCGTLSIGIGISYIMQAGVVLRKKLLVMVFVLFSLVPFFLGASRGSIFALFLPFVIMFFSRGNAVANLRLMAVMLIIAVGGVYLSGLFGSSLIERFSSLNTDISRGSESAVRLELWKGALQQFMDNPVFGDALEVRKFRFYPHNVILEVLMATGIVGFIPFVALLIYAFKRTVFIFRNDPANSWLGVVFIQSLMQNMFSGSLYGASWLWVSLGLLCSYEYAAQRRNNLAVFN